ncbi:MAG: DUF1289 domain-containing protein [Spongiibacteraceae bacterium]
MSNTLGVVVDEKVIVKSPCIGVCVLNEGDICEGCYRSSEEIGRWSELSAPEKKEVIVLAHSRFKKLNKHFLL